VAGVTVRPARKTVTVVFTDVAESSGLGAGLDPESLALALASWFDHRVADELLHLAKGNLPGATSARAAAAAARQPAPSRAADA